MGNIRMSTIWGMYGKLYRAVCALVPCGYVGDRGRRAFWWERFRRGGVKFGWKGGVEKSSAKGLRLPSLDFRTPPQYPPTAYNPPKMNFLVLYEFNLLCLYINISTDILPPYFLVAGRKYHICFRVNFCALRPDPPQPQPPPIINRVKPP